METATRVSIDCRDFPSDSKCSLRMSGTEAEVLATARAHAAAVHGHEDSPELVEMIRGGLKPSND